MNDELHAQPRKGGIYGQHNEEARNKNPVQEIAETNIKTYSEYEKTRIYSNTKARTAKNLLQLSQ